VDSLNLGRPDFEKSNLMINKILVANRGAIAVRIFRTLKQMGIQSVAVYSEADAESIHVSVADEAYSLGEGAAANAYLDQEKLFTIIKKANVDAVHPGYGFLSENAEFAEACEFRNVIFLGPGPEQMKAFGLKHVARDLAKAHNVPLLPGTDLLGSLEEAVQAASTIGYPVMLKSTAGGGGIGMQLCYSEDELLSAYDSVKRLSENNFSNDGLFLEKFVERARHIEVQVFADGEGNAIALGERDCSSQRRNQKVIEEAPAPNLDEAVRQQLCEVAVNLLSAVKYRSAGTVEYVYDPTSEEFYFLEVNTRLQVEHGVTELVFGVDLVRWMVELGAKSLPPLEVLQKDLRPRGHAVQVRVYAENPHNNFQPSAGLLSEVVFPPSDGIQVRIDHWLEAGIEISPFFDPMLAKIICYGDSRGQALKLLDATLSETSLYGVETNIDYVRQVLGCELFTAGQMYTRYLNDYSFEANTIDVLVAGTQTTIQDFPARSGYWNIGVPPSGPFDSLSFQLANRLLHNADDAAGLEITLNGPSLRFNSDTTVVLAGSSFSATLDDRPVSFYRQIPVCAGQVLEVGKPTEHGARCYLAVAGGIQCPDYLGSKSTFTLGQFGGHNGRALRLGDVLHFNPCMNTSDVTPLLPTSLLPCIGEHWELRVIYGPHGAPDFFTDADIDTFFDARWEVHYNSSRTGIRLIGPKPEWARSDGGEAGMHPSNIHDNAYAVGAVDFTGDMPVILGPDGPSLGGFVCPATVISADLWKLGQLKAGDTLSFLPVSIIDAVALERDQKLSIKKLQWIETEVENISAHSCVIEQKKTESGLDVVYRPAGDHYLLVEYGPQVLDINLRFRVHALMLWLEDNAIDGMFELTPGIRSLQVHYDSQRLTLENLMVLLTRAEAELGDCSNLEVPTRVIHIPLSWDDRACHEAIEKYMQSVREDAPWCPSNLEFIRRINGLESIEQVKQIVFDASYLVMGLGDVYLGAPVATPLDPRHRLVTTKYNPARTWTAENSVGIGGSYLCVYGMEGPGGYQFVGRTLQMWNRYRKTDEFQQPWLLRFFDQIRFYEVTHDELEEIRRDFPLGQYPLKIEETTFKLRDYNDFIVKNQSGINEFTELREKAFDKELQYWIESGQLNYARESAVAVDLDESEELGENFSAVESHVAGNIWQVLVEPDEQVKKGQTVIIIESMKMEIEVMAPFAGKVSEIRHQAGAQVSAGQSLLILEQTL
jgi:urea carboxylase